MKILFLSSWFPNRVTPNNGDFVERHALAVSTVSKTAVLHVCPDAGISGRFMEIFEIQKSELFEVIIYIRKFQLKNKRLERMGNIFLYGIAYLIGYWIVKAQLGRPDVIHANIIVPVSKVAFFLNRLTRIPYIISEHWTGYLTGDSHKEARNYDRPVARAFALVPVTDNLRQALIDSGYKTQYFTVPNVVDTGLFRPRAKQESDRKKRLLHVSSMKEDHKNISGIIRCIKKLCQIRKDFVFTFAGDASDQQRLEVKSGAVSDCVEFTGEIEHNKVAALMQQSDVFVLFSNVENLPCVIIEALACGMPVISTNVGGISEVVNEQNGILIERDDEEALLKSLDYMLDHFDEYDPQRLHDYAAEKFSIKVIASKFLKIYQEALTNTRK